MEIAQAINHIIAGNNLTKFEAYQTFERIVRNETGSMNQGGFLAALTAKGATADEIAAIRKVIIDLDTNKVTINTEKPLTENSGTGMDKVKTFNISTAAAIIAASCGAAMARHGSRAITSKCGTVDVAEALGISVEENSDFIGRSIENCGLGLFNGMSPLVHPTALARILGELSFGTILNTAASLANPADPVYGIRGVGNPNMVETTADIMKSIGYQRVLVLHGHVGENEPGIDEASTMGRTVYTQIDEKGNKHNGSFHPEELGLQRAKPEDLATTGNPQTEAGRLAAILAGEGNGPQTDIVILNAAMILLTTQIAENPGNAIKAARESIENGTAYSKLEEWVCTQSHQSAEEASRHLKQLRRTFRNDIIFS